VSIELYEGKEQSNATVFSSMENTVTPLVERQAYILPASDIAAIRYGGYITFKDIVPRDEYFFQGRKVKTVGTFCMSADGILLCDFKIMFLLALLKRPS
jgi:hypothetical protein